MKIALPLAVLVLTALACDNRGAPQEAPAEARDSAGVRIVSSAAPRWKTGAEWKLSPAPQVEIGKADSDTLHQFAGIASVVPLSDGRIVVANRKPYVIRVYSAAGKYMNDIGRRGQGPGEYEYLTRVLRLPGDSVMAVTESRANTVFASDGKAGRAVNLEKAPRDFGEMAQNGIAPRPLALFADGSILSVASVSGGFVEGARFPEGVSSDSLEFHHYSPTGTRMQSLGVFDEYERFVAGELHYVRSATTERVYTATGDRFYTGNGRTFEIRSYATDGALKEILRLTTPAVSFTSDSISKRREKRIAAAKTPEARAEIEKIYGIMDFPDSLPRFDDILVADNGGVWVKEYATVSATRWYVFDKDGSWLGAMELPSRFSLKAVSDNLAYGVALDDDDVETIRVYRIIKSPGE